MPADARIEDDFDRLAGPIAERVKMFHDDMDWIERSHPKGPVVAQLIRRSQDTLFFARSEYPFDGMFLAREVRALIEGIVKDTQEGVQRG